MTTEEHYRREAMSVAELEAAQAADVAQVEWTFQGVAITLSAPTAKEAYTKLCEGLAAMGADWETDVYHRTDDVEGINERDCSELYPTESEVAR